MVLFIKKDMPLYPSKSPLNLGETFDCWGKICQAFFCSENDLSFYPSKSPLNLGEIFDWRDIELCQVL